MTKNGSEVHLTPTEWGMLEMLVRNRGKLVGREELLKEVWGPAYAKETHYLRVYLAQLRRKLEDDPSHPVHLLTEAGMGYRFQEYPRARRKAPIPAFAALSSAGHGIMPAVYRADMAGYRELFDASIEDPSAFWADAAKGGDLDAGAAARSSTTAIRRSTAGSPTAS